MLIASREDLLADAADPEAQLDALRAVVGPQPCLIVTDADHGAWIDQRGARTLVGVPRVVRDVPMVGAGDAYASLLLGAMGRGRDSIGAARDAAAGVAEMLAARSDRRLVVLGDVHGMDRRLVGLLRDAQLIDGGGAWIGRRDELWCLGDLVDRGTGGSKVIGLLRRLAGEAEAAGGRVGSVLGNHEVLMLAARAMPDDASSGPSPPSARTGSGTVESRRTSTASPTRTRRGSPGCRPWSAFPTRCLSTPTPRCTSPLGRRSARPTSAWRR